MDNRVSWLPRQNKTVLAGLHCALASFLETNCTCLLKYVIDGPVLSRIAHFFLCKFAPQN